MASLEAGATSRLAINADRQRRQTLVGRPAEPPVQADRPDRPQHCRGVAVRQGAADADAVRGDRDAAFQEGAKALDQRGRPRRQIGQGALSDQALLAKALAQQRRPGVKPRLGYRFNIHGLPCYCGGRDAILRHLMQTKYCL